MISIENAYICLSYKWTETYVTVLQKRYDTKTVAKTHKRQKRFLREFSTRIMSFNNISRCLKLVK